MPILSQILIILGISLAGEVGARLLPFPMPGSVIAMVLLFLVLQSRIIKYEAILPTGEFLLKNMAFFLVPAAVNIISYFHLIGNYLLAFVLICLVSTVLAFFATYATTRMLIKAQQARKGAAG